MNGVPEEHVPERETTDKLGIAAWDVERPKQYRKHGCQPPLNPWQVGLLNTDVEPEREG